VSGAVCALALISFAPSPLNAASNHNGQAWAPTGTVSGAHYNVSVLTIDSTVYVATQSWFVVTAATINVTATGVLNADACGYGPNHNGSNSTGEGDDTPDQYLGGGGGGHGGYGGYGGRGAGEDAWALGNRALYAGGPAWGSAASPTNFGSAGGSGDNSMIGAGGSGGGAIKLVASGAVTNSGTITANGGNGAGANSRSGGGGSGGSIWIVCATLDGGGTVSAAGGDGGSVNDVNGGGGAGGRIAITCGGNAGVATDIRAGAGGGSAIGGQSGTLVVNGVEAMRPDGDFDHGGADWTLSANTVVAGTHDNVGTFTIQGGTTATVRDMQPFELYAANITIETNATLTADGQGISWYHGDIPGDAEGGNGGNPETCSGGGGYGGAGGYGTNALDAVAWAGGSTYGSETAPTNFGGASGHARKASGVQGGGVIRLAAVGTLAINGEVSADGEPGSGSNTGASGGGAGGSIWLSCATLKGAGTLTANGGAGGYEATDQTCGGGGGGGRIAIYASGGNTNGMAITVNKGAANPAGEDGAPGTVFTSFILQGSVISIR
jgi:hypothetical protein